ncbi:hypothetical protein SeLEV6574_g06339 [Synchytrium endobioticum]|nr:hypothetical protein SeLEV6574_g06339 [Synchytrium endobioticum]
MDDDASVSNLMSRLSTSLDKTLQEFDDLAASRVVVSVEEAIRLVSEANYETIKESVLADTGYSPQTVERLTKLEKSLALPVIYHALVFHKLRLVAATTLKFLYHFQNQQNYYLPTDTQAYLTAGIKQCISCMDTHQALLPAEDGPKAAEQLRLIQVGLYRLIMEYKHGELRSGYAPELPPHHSDSELLAALECIDGIPPSALAEHPDSYMPFEFKLLRRSYHLYLVKLGTHYIATQQCNLAKMNPFIAKHKKLCHQYQKATYGTYQASTEGEPSTLPVSTSSTDVTGGFAATLQATDETTEPQLEQCWDVTFAGTRHYISQPLLEVEDVVRMIDTYPYKEQSVTGSSSHGVGLKNDRNAISSKKHQLRSKSP